MNVSSNATIPAMSSSPPPDAAIAAARNQLYPQQLWWFLATFIGIVAVGQFISWVSSRLFAPCPPPVPEKRDVEGRASTRRFSWSRLPVAIVNHFRVIAFRNTVDVGEKYTFTYAEVFITIVYIVAVFTWEFSYTSNVAGSPLTLSYWSGRAAALAVSQFPLITALGTKNSLIAYITGISYDKLNFVHRMMARVVFMLLWIHAGSKLYNLSLTPGSFSRSYVQLGLTAIIAYTILMVVAYRPIRARFYELFFFTHFVMVLIMLIGGYAHAKQLTPLYTYIWPSFLIWALDRFIRVVRLVFYNNYFGSGRRPATSGDATVELLSPQFVRLRFPRPSQLKWTPGQAAFLIMPSVSKVPFEAHPFTIASVDSRYRLAGKPAGLGSSDSTLTLSESRDPMMSRAPSDWEELEFMINVREGFTKELAKAAQKGEKVKVFVDGPYGFSPNLKHDDTVVLVAGGSGISLVLAMFLGVVSDVRNGKSSCRRVVFIWSIRDPTQLDWISKAMGEVLEVAPEHLDIAVRIFVTGRARAAPKEPMMNDDDMMESPDGMRTVMVNPPRPLESFAAVEITQGRPELVKLLKGEVSAAAGRISVTVCGSQAIAKTCRDALRIPFSATMNGGPSVVLHVEAFGYA